METSNIVIIIQWYNNYLIGAENKMPDYIITIRVEEQFWKNIMAELVLNPMVAEILECSKKHD